MRLNFNSYISKCFFCVSILVCAIFLFAYNTYAIGWEYINGDWYYMDTNGEAYANCFVDKDEDKYYVGADGKIYRGRLFEIDDDIYYAKPDGKLARNQFVYIEYDEAAEIGVDDGIYYFGDKYKSYRKTGSVFRRMIEGKYYAFDENGKVITGWLNEEGVELDSKESWLYDGVYHTDDNGELIINGWYDFAKDEGSYEFSDDKTELGATDYNYLEHMWMYFDRNGKKVKAENTSVEKKRKIKDIEYAFDENGVMITNFTRVGGMDYTQKSNPTSKISSTIYGEENDGGKVEDKWLWLYPSKELDEQEYNDQEMHWWHTDKSGHLVRNKIKEYEGKKYVFDGIGRMKAGFVFFSGSNEYVANYMPEDLTRDDFLYSYAEGSKLYGHELSDLRYFGDDDKLDGSMRSGEVEVELSDGKWTFAFFNSGIAYGNRRKLRKSKNMYYINGLKLTALEDMRYGIVKVDSDEYKLVGKNGKIKKASKKVIIDDEGNNILMVNSEIVGYKTASSLPGNSTVIKWRNATEDTEAGFYYYDKDAENGVDKYHYGLCLDPSVTTTMVSSDVDSIPKDMRVNFR